MDLIQSAYNLGFTLKNEEYYLWEVQKWLREVYGIHIQVYVMEQWLENGNEMEIYFEVNLKTTQNIGGLKNVKSNMIKFKSYEQALEVGLQEALKLIE